MNAQEPYFKDGTWQMDVDPDDHNYVVANVAKDLTDRGTTVASVEGIPSAGVVVIEPAEAQGNLMVALVTLDTTKPAPHFLRFRMTCVNKERFDRTMYFNPEDH